MAANSNHYADIRLWIIKVIDSCTNREQCVSAFKLVQLYSTKIKDHPNRSRLILELERKVEYHLKTIPKVEIGKVGLNENSTYTG